MKGTIAFFKTTLIGGVVFLIPVILMIIVAGKALQWLRKLTEAIAQTLPNESLVGVALVDIIGVALLIVVCFIAGIVARTTLASKALQKAESSFLWQIPGYGFVKGVTDSLNPEIEVSSLKPVLIRLDDCWQIAYEVEHMADHRVAVFIPDAPNPWAGSVIVVNADRIEPMNASMIAVAGCLRQLGRGAETLITK